jgi:hypothetical protein
VTVDATPDETMDAVPDADPPLPYTLITDPGHVSDTAAQLEERMTQIVADELRMPWER